MKTNHLLVIKFIAMTIIARIVLLKRGSNAKYSTNNTSPKISIRLEAPRAIMNLINSSAAFLSDLLTVGKTNNLLVTNTKIFNNINVMILARL